MSRRRRARTWYETGRACAVEDVKRGFEGRRRGPPPREDDVAAPRRAWVLNVYTEPDFRRRGLARRVMETIAAWCAAQGLSRVFLHASDAGRPLYESLGFEPTNEMKLGLGSRGGGAA
jgi:GNAT superfamily N-acetyltransferase